MISETSGVVAIMSAVFSATVIAEVLFLYIYDLDVPCGCLTYCQWLSQSKVSPNPQLENYCTIFIEHPSFVFSAVIGEIDEEADANLDLNSIRADPLNAVVYWLMDIVQTSTM